MHPNAHVMSKSNAKSCPSIEIPEIPEVPEVPERQGQIRSKRSRLGSRARIRLKGQN